MTTRKILLLTVSFSLLFALGPASGGIPVIRLKVAEYPRELAFKCPQGGEYLCGNRQGKIPAGATCTISGNVLSPATIRYHVMVESVPMRDPEKVALSLQKWKATGKPVHTLELGKRSYAPDGRTVSYDGRVLHIGLGQFLDQPPAQALVDELSGVGTSSWILEEILKLSEGPLTLKIDGKIVARGNNRLQIVPAATVLLSRVEFARGYSWHGFADRSYRGVMDIGWGARNALDAILITNLESLIAGVVPSEISSKAAIGALQAQAVAARGEILAKVGLRHLHEGFDFCAEQHCQVFAGETGEVQSMAAAIAPTQGMILHSPEGNIVDAVYGANCGGHTEANHLVWTSPPDPQLSGIWDGNPPMKPDLSKEENVSTFILKPPPSHCGDPSVEGGDKFRWEKTLTGKEWTEVEERGKVGRLREVKDLARGGSGRLTRLTLVGENGLKSVMKELPIRKLFGGLRSACFIVDWKRDPQGFLTGARFRGAGWGHGVGMCQTGAQSLAKRGVGFERILLHYFPGSHLVRIY